MRFFLFLFLSLYIESNITERDDVKEFIKFAISNSDLDRDEVLAFIKDAKPSKKAVVLKNNQQCNEEELCLLLYQPPNTIRVH